MAQELRVSGRPANGLFGATVAFFIGLASVALFGPTAKALKDDFGLNATTLGLLIGIPSLMGGLLRIPFGAWVETTGGKKPNLILLSLAFVGVLGLAIVTPLKSLPLMVLFGAIAGCGVATFSVSMGQVSYWYPKKKQGTANGIFGGVANTSPGIASLWIPSAIALFGGGIIGIQNTYFVWLIYLAVGITLYIIFGRNAPYFQLRKQGADEATAKKIAAEQHGQELFPSGTAIQSLKTTAKFYQTWLLVAIYFTSFGGFLALTAWFPNYWQTMYGVTLYTAVIYTAIFSIGASFMRVLGGFISDKIGGERTSFFALIFLLAGAIFMLLSTGDFNLAIIGMSLIAIGMGVNNAATFKILPNVIPSAMGGASGWIGGLAAIGGLIFPVSQGFFIQNAKIADPGYNMSFILYIGMAVISLILLGVLVAKKAKK